MPANASEQPLAPELDAVANAAEEQLRALAGENPLEAAPLAQVSLDAATAAIASGHPIVIIAQAEQRGQKHARTALSRELLARVERAARRRRETEDDLHQAIARATRLGLAQRDIATAAQIAHGTVRAILTRANGNAATAPAEPDGTPFTESRPPIVHCLPDACRRLLSASSQPSDTGLACLLGRVRSSSAKIARRQADTRNPRPPALEDGQQDLAPVPAPALHGDVVRERADSLPEAGSAQRATAPIPPMTNRTPRQTANRPENPTIPEVNS
jgi:hypothetical protein